MYILSHSDTFNGAEIVGVKCFHIEGEKSCSVDWKEYGLEMSVDSGTIPASDTCEVTIKALVGGQFELPERTNLISGIYAISFSQKLLKPVKLSVEHCSAMKKHWYKHLWFIRAEFDDLPAVSPFQCVHGGEFPYDSRYGSIFRTEFCIFGIVRENGPSPDSEDNDEPPSDSDTDNEESTNNEVSSGEENGVDEICNTYDIPCTCTCISQT